VVDAPPENLTVSQVADLATDFELAVLFTSQPSFARGLNGNIEGGPVKPGIGRSGVVDKTGGRRDAGVWALTGGNLAGLGHLPPGPGHIQVRVIIPGGHSKHGKIPGAGRPRRNFPIEIGFQKFFKLKVIQPPVFQSGGASLRR
jgi:hypothetical protein